METQGASGFVNAMLRKITPDDYEKLFNIEDKKEKISKTQSMPMWIIDELLENNTIEEVEEICKNLNEKPELIIRINKLKTTKQELICRLKEKSIDIEEVNIKLNLNNKCTKEDIEQKQLIEKYEKQLKENFLIIKNVKNIENMEEFKQGLFTVQDTSAGLTAIILEPKENETILDACSAPGGKTTYIAELMNNKGKIYAWDIYPHRIKLIEENCKRLGITIVETQIQDASESIKNNCQTNPAPMAILPKKTAPSGIEFDKILLDVPCLGIGVIKRKPDIKWQRKKEDVKEITDLQYKILENCANYLKDNGVLVYSTCSILKEENEDIIRKFLQNNPKFIIEEEIKIKPTKKTDGFYICKIKNINKQ